MSFLLHRKQALQELLILQHFLGADQLNVAIIHHTDCGAMRMNAAELRAEIEAIAPGRADEARHVTFDFFGESQLEESVKSDVAWLVGHPLFRFHTETGSGEGKEAKGSVVSGWVYDLKTGRVSAATSYLSMKGYLANYVDRFVSSFESNIKIFWSWYHM